MGCCTSSGAQKGAQVAARKSQAKPQPQRAKPKSSPQRLKQTFPGYEMIDRAAGEAKLSVDQVGDEWEAGSQPSPASDPADVDYGNLVKAGGYVVTSKIAVGAQASVWEAHREGQPGEKRVLKAYSKHALQTERHDSGMVHESIWYEFVLLQRLGKGHPGIPILDEALESSTHSYLVMELMEGVQLRTRIEDGKWWRCRRRVAFDVTLGGDGRVGMSFRGVNVSGVVDGGPAAAAQRRRGAAAGAGLAAGMRVCSVAESAGGKAVGSETVTTGEGLAAALDKRAQPGASLVITASEEPEPENPEAYDPRRIFKCIADIVHYMHHHGVAHRDLKPENIILVGSGRDAVAKLVDFGTGAQVANEEAGPRKRFSTMGGHREPTRPTVRGNRAKSVLLARPVGTASYFSPEVVRTFVDLTNVAEEQSKSTSSQLEGIDICGTKLQASYYRGRPYDVWSCGAILYELLANQVLFADTEGWRQSSQQWQGVDDSLDTPRALKFQQMDPGPQQLLRRCLAKLPDDRLTAEDVLKDPWLRETSYFDEQTA